MNFPIVDKSNKTITPVHTPFDISIIPPQLHQGTMWITWDWYWDDKWKKTPIDPENGRRVAYDAVQLTLTQALNYCAEKGLGVGINLDATDACAIDIDNEVTNGEVTSQYQKLLEPFKDVYCETSPSGEGLRLLGFGTPTTVNQSSRHSLEVYTAKRFVAITGQANGTAGKPLVDITRITDELTTKVIIAAVSTNTPTPANTPTPIPSEENLYTLHTKLLSAPSDDEHLWIQAGRAYHFESGGSDKALQLWKEWSSKSDKYEERTCDSKWIKFKTDALLPTTLLTIIKLLKEAGYSRVPQPDITPEPLDSLSTPEPTAIPESCLPTTLLNAAKELGDWTATAYEAAVLSGVFIASAAINKNVIIHAVDVDLTARCQCGVIIAMGSGARKSEVYKKMNAPFFDYEAKLQNDWHTHKNEHLMMIEILEAQRKGHITDAKKSEDLASKQLLAKEAAKVADQIAQLNRPEPVLSMSDSSEEKLIRILKEQDGVLAVISDDARTTIKNILGQYQKGDNTSEGVYINGLTGTPIDYARVTDDVSIKIRQPCLNALLFVQPDSALRLKNSDMYKTSGLAARIPIVFYPIDPIHMLENTTYRPIAVDKLEPYYKALGALCINRRDNPLNVRVNNGASVCSAMSKKLADHLRGGWSYDETNKFVMLVLTYATIFAALDDDNFRRVYVDERSIRDEVTLPQRYIDQAYQFAVALFEGAHASDSHIVQSNAPQLAKKVLLKIQELYANGSIYEGFTISDRFNKNFSSSSRHLLQEMVRVLVSKGWLFETKHRGAKRKLNGGFPDKLVGEGERVYHLNERGIKRLESVA